MLGNVDVVSKVDLKGIVEPYASSEASPNGHQQQENLERKNDLLRERQVFAGRGGGLIFALKLENRALQGEFDRMVENFQNWRIGVRAGLRLSLENSEPPEGRIFPLDAGELIQIGRSQNGLIYPQKSLEKDRNAQDDEKRPQGPSRANPVPPESLVKTQEPGGYPRLEARAHVSLTAKKAPSSPVLHRDPLELSWLGIVLVVFVIYS